MQMCMSMHVAQKLEQKLTQRLKQELRQELKLLLKQLLKLVQALKLGQVVTMRQVRDCWHAINQVPVTDWNQFARETARQCGHAATMGLAIALEIGREVDPQLDELGGFAEKLRHAVHADDERQRQARRDQDHALAMRMVVRNPKWFGGASGHAYNLAQLLDKVPQHGRQGQILWALCGGWAVEILTGKHEREHHDLDMLVLCGDPCRLDTDAVEPDNYFDVLNCTSSYVRLRCLTVRPWTYKQRRFDVIMVCPEFLFCSKFVRRPRPQDWIDVQLLVSKFAKTWDIRLITAIAKRNRCGFDSTRELSAILKTRDPDAIIERLASFH